jgi:hypothetical protein
MPTVLDQWHRAVAHQDASILDDLLAEDVVFSSPALHTPQVGKAVASMYLRAALQVLGGSSFRYLEEWVGERSAVLEFEATVGKMHVNGVDVIHWNDAGRITRFKVMVRPAKGLEALMGAMAKQLMAS